MNTDNNVIKVQAHSCSRSKDIYKDLPRAVRQWELHTYSQLFFLLALNPYFYLLLEEREGVGISRNYIFLHCYRDNCEETK